MRSRLHGIALALLATLAIAAPAAYAQLANTKLVYMSDEAQAGNFDLWTVTYDGATFENLTPSSTQAERLPAWSPDGSQIAYVHSGDVYIHTVGSASPPTQITFDTGNDSPTWSPDGTEIAYQKDRVYEIYRIPAAGGTATLVTTNGWMPEWSPIDATKIAYTDITSPGTLFVIDLTGGPGAPVTNTDATYPGGQEESASWSPDGTQIVFDGNAHRGRDIYRVGATGGIPTRLTTTGTNSAPTWSPDATEIAFNSDRGGWNHIWRMDAVDGDTTVVNVTNNANTVSISSADWSPFFGPSITLSAPTPDQLFSAGTTSVGLTVSTASHPAPGYWAWQLDSAFPDTGAVQGTSVSSGDTDTIGSLADGEAHTVYVALVDVSTDQLLDATTTPTARSSVSFSIDAPPTAVAITAPSDGQTFVPGTTSTQLAVDITAHDAPGHWHWQLDTPFPASGVAGGNMVTSGTTATITGLVDGASHTVYVTLVDGNHAVLEPAIADQVTFSVDTLPTDYIQVLSTQGAPNATVSVPIAIYDTSTLAVTGVDITLVYDATILTPTDDGAGTTTAFSFGNAVSPSWSMEQNVVTPGQIEVVMGGDFNNPLISTGILAYVDFTVDASAAPNATSALSLTRADLNEGQVASTAVDGVFTVVSLLYGDVTGNGTLGGYDASWVLEHVVNGLLVPPVDVTFPIENTAPVWATLPLTEEDADAVADVDTTDGYIASTDASLILQRAVGLITSFPVEGATAPSFDPPSFGHMLTASASSERPGAQITVTLTASEAAELYSCELLLSFDSALLRPIDVSLASMEHGGQQPLLVQRERGDQLAIAFASSRPVDQSGLVLEVTFQTERGIHRAASGSVRASHLRLNGARLNPDFIYTFHIEPYQFQLMANYPNPFNPETWIPFELSKDADVTVRIYGLDGKIVRTLDLGYQPMGEYRARESAAYWDGRNEIGERVASGLYVYELQAGEQRAVRRMVISK